MSNIILNCLIVDDDDLSRNILADLIKDTSSLKLCALCSDPIEAFNFLKESIFGPPQGQLKAVPGSFLHGLSTDKTPD